MKLLIAAVTLALYGSILSAASPDDTERRRVPAASLTAESATTLEDKELLSKQIVEYFKRVAQETRQPVKLKITLSDTYGVGTTLEDEQDLDGATLPACISKSYLMKISGVLRELLPSITSGKDLQSFMLSTTIWVDAPNHREKINGFCSLGK